MVVWSIIEIMLNPGWNLTIEANQDQIRTRSGSHMIMMKFVPFRIWPGPVPGQNSFIYFWSGIPDRIPIRIFAFGPAKNSCPFRTRWALFSQAYSTSNWSELDKQSSRIVVGIFAICKSLILHDSITKSFILVTFSRNPVHVTTWPTLMGWVTCVCGGGGGINENSRDVR